jgi:hypothetical protein
MEVACVDTPNRRPACSALVIPQRGIFRFRAPKQAVREGEVADPDAQLLGEAGGLPGDWIRGKPTRADAGDTA